MTGFIDRIQNSTITRRNFIKGSAATVTALGLTACGENKLTSLETGQKVDAENGKWIPAACWVNCGGKCYLSAYVVDNTVLRVKTDDTHPDTTDYPQQRACLRGRAQRQHIFGADRIKYPMKRKHWKPGGGDKSLRGKDEWERISWEEALDYVAEEIKKAKEKYGNGSILVPNWGSSYTDFYEFLHAYGGYTVAQDTASYGTYVYASLMLGMPPVDLFTSANDRFDLRKSETIVLYGANPAWASPGSPSYHYLQAKKAGAQFVFVGPSYNESANLLDAKWIRVRPGSDTAFLLSVAYTMLVEDDPLNNPIIDWDFLNRYSVGFDADHMPADSTINENFKDYVLGKYDGQPKTPEWASEICGTPIEDIKWYAREMRKDKKVALLHNYAPARCNSAEDFPQIFMTIGAMGGHYGKSGHCCGSDHHYASGNSGTPLIAMGATGAPIIPNPCPESITAAELWESILKGKYHHMGTVGGIQAGERDIDIHVILHSWRNSLQTNLNAVKGIEVHKKVDFVVACAFSLNASAQYSDIVLPITSQWERLSDYNYCTFTNREMQLFPSRVIEPLYEAKSDQWIARELSKRLGLNEKEIYPLSEEQRYFNQIAGAKVINEQGTDYETLVTITEADIAEWEVDGKPQQGLIPLKELMEKGVYQVKRYEGDPYGFIAYQDYVKDPDKNPLPSKSGKLEIYSQTKADFINSMGRSEIKPYPTYSETLNGFEQSFNDWENKVKGDYPYQIYNPHYLRRGHTVFDNVPWLRDALKNPVFISAHDAKEKNVNNGDTILIYNENGKVLRKASITERLMPGCIALPHGTWMDIDEKTGIDDSGSDNVLTSPVTSACGVSGYNTQLVNFDKFDGDPLNPDYLKPQRIIKL